MFIEFTEYLRCPEAHDAVWLVLAPDRIDQRHVASGTLGCPACGTEYRIHDGVVRFGPVPPSVSSGPLPAADVVQALIGLESPGGYVALVGSAAGLAQPLRLVMTGVRFVTLNAPEHPGPDVTMLESSGRWPLRDRVMRGVVLGAELAQGALSEAHRVLLNGQRIVALSDQVAPPDQFDEMARGQGLWVGRRR